MKDLLQLLLRVYNVDLEWWSGYIHPWPSDADHVQSRLRWVIATQDGAVTLTVPIHLHLESTWFFFKVKKKRKLIIFFIDITTTLLGMCFYYFLIQYKCIHISLIFSTCYFNDTYIEFQCFTIQIISTSKLTYKIFPIWCHKYLWILPKLTVTHIVNHPLTFGHIINLLIMFWWSLPLGPLILTVSWPAPAPRVSTMNLLW